jgi:hypothetical protein
LRVVARGCWYVFFVRVGGLYIRHPLLLQISLIIFFCYSSFEFARGFAR